jgi:hypothetical protein
MKMLEKNTNLFVIIELFQNSPFSRVKSRKSILENPRVFYANNLQVKQMMKNPVPKPAKIIVLMQSC